MITVLFFIESLEHGGAEKSLLSLLKHLDYSKYNVEILTVKKEGALKNQLPSEVTFNHLILNFGLISKLRFRCFKALLSKRHNAQFFWKAFQKEIPQYKKSYDLAIGWGQGFATYYVAEKVNAKKKVAWINTNYDEAGYIFAHDQALYEIYDRINGVSPFAVEVMSKYIAEQKLIQITNIIDEAEVKIKSKLKCSSDFNSDLFNIVSVGRLVKPKAFQLALHAAKILTDKNVNFHWYIVGDGSERMFLQHLMKELSIEKCITLVGFDTNPYAFIRQADLYVQTSLFEGLGRTLIEAAILKKPIVTTDFDTAHRLVDHNNTGFITSKTSDGIANAIFRLYSDKNKYSKMVENLNSNTRISASEVVEQFDKVVSELLCKVQ